MMKKKIVAPALVGLCLLAALAVLVVPAAAFVDGGACCMPDGSCHHESFESACTEISGIFHAGMSCAENPCGSPVGGLTEPLALSTLVLPALAVAAGAAGAVALSRRACRPGA